MSPDIDEQAEQTHPLRKEVDTSKFSVGLNLIPEFNGANWIIFKRKIVTQFTRMDIDSYLKHEPSMTTAVERRNDRAALSEISMRLAQVQYNQIAECINTAQAWDVLCKAYDQPKSATASTKFIDFIEERKSQTETLKAYLDRLTEKYQDMMSIDIKIGDQAFCGKVLHGLPAEYNAVKAAARASKIETIATLTSLLLSTERELTPAKPQEPTYDVKAARNDPRRKNHFKSKRYCKKCKQTTHDTDKCWVLHPELRPRRDKDSTPTKLNGFKVMRSTITPAGDYLIDSGANASVTNERQILTDYKKLVSPVFIQTCNGQTSKAFGKGTLKLSTSPPITIRDVLYSPEITGTLIAACSIVNQGLKIVIDGDMHIQTKEGATILIAEMRNGLYYIPTGTYFQANAAISLDLAHKRFGHASDERLRNLQKSAIGIEISGGERPFCDICAQNKSRRHPFPEQRRTMPTRRYQMVSSDLKGPFLIPSSENFRYYITFNCLYSTWTWVSFLKSKSAEEVINAFQRFVADAQADTHERLAILLTDGGKEYVNELMSTFLLQKGIKHQRTVPYSPQQNGQAERRNLTIMQVARCVLSESGLPDNYWPHAVRYAVDTSNLLPTKRLDWKTPFEFWQQQVPEVARMRPFGCIAWAHIDKAYRSSIEPTSEKCIFLGYASHQKGYVVQRLSDKMILVRRDVTFNELQMSESQSRAEHPMEIIDEFVYEIYNTIPVPETFAEAMNSPNSTQWRQAAQEEIDAHTRNHTWKLVNKPKDVKPIKGKWVFTVKTNPDGKPRFKARFVAKGFSQREGIDFDETFSSVLAHTSLRTILSLAAIHGWKIYQKDFTTAYLNAPLSVPIYMFQPAGFIKPGEDQKVCLLEKALYGLKQAGREWQSTLFTKLCENKYIQSKKEPCIFYKLQNSKTTIIGVYVDDLLITGDDQAEMNSISDQLGKSFQMKHLGEADKFLGMEITRRNGEIHLSQTKYIQDVIKRFKQENCKPVHTPMSVIYEQTANEEITDKYPIREIIGSLSYIANGTRPDIAFAINNLCRHVAKPTASLWKAAQRVVKYLNTTQTEGLIFKGSSTRIDGWADSNYAMDSIDRKSTSGMIIRVGDNPIIWKSRKQKSVALSTTEAEFMAASDAAREIIWLRDLLQELSQDDSSAATPLYQDNQGAIFLENNNCSNQRSKHIDVRYHFIREQVNKKRIEIIYCPTAEMIADIFTKPVNESQFKKFKNAIMRINEGDTPSMNGL